MVIRTLTVAVASVLLAACTVGPDYVRPNDVDYLQCDATKARDVLGWQPQIHFAELVRLMVDADRAQLQEELTGALAHLPRES